MACACDYCAKQVKDDEPLKMNTSFLKIVYECTNLFWMCDECSKLMKITRFRTVIESVGDTVNNMQEGQDLKNAELRDLITENGKQLLLLSKRVTSLSTANQSGTPKPKPTPKRTRGSDPVPSKPLVFGTNALANASITCVPPEEKLFRLYVTRFANHTTASQVEELVKNAIGQNELVQVTALVKREALIRSVCPIWPGNCGFREFEDLQRKTSSPQSSGDGQRAKKPMLSFAVLPAIVTPSGSTLGSPNPIGRDNEPFLTPRSGNSDSDSAAMEH
ncbi:hypothetical protein pipiens_015835 [Culex pipiens pipiens]|uniref:Uncharacterized protein n=1 Tax=Culex pipiens pipiens TaxID=38569 RepID=A0ABD1CNV3_CULPP